MAGHRDSACGPQAALAEMVAAMADAGISFLAADLAPGDGRALELNRDGFLVDRIDSAAHPLLTLAYERLWAEFGAAHEMETRDVIERRLAWQPAAKVDDCWLRYDLMLVRRDGSLVAVRDHTAIVAHRGGGACAVVHLSHVLVGEAWRRTGLAGWLRAWPVQTARACLAAAGCPVDSPITLVAEMEHPDPAHPSRLIRLKAYEKAGFKKVDPAIVPYVQPDFRPPAQIDAGGGPRPLPFGLVLRQVGRESEPALSGAVVRTIVGCLYQMYGTGFRPADMQAAWATLRHYPAADAEVRLVPPTQ